MHPSDESLFKGYKHRILAQSHSASSFFRKARERLATDWSIFPQASLLQLPFRGIIQEIAIPEKWQAEHCNAYLTALCGSVQKGNGFSNPFG